MPLGTERTAVQNPFIRYAEEAGWTYLSPEDALRQRPGPTSPVLLPVLVEQLQKLNPGVVDHRRAEDVARAFCRVPPNVEGNLAAWEYLKGLRTVFVEGERREKNVRFMDPVNVTANKFHVTGEWTFSNGTPPDIRADMVLLINGIPVLLVETKAANKKDGLGEALEDIRFYHKHGPELLALSQLFALTHLVKFSYGATWAISRKGVFNWRDEQAGDFETLVKTFVSPRRVLRVVHDFILFTRKDDELSKVVLRPHQMRAVERCVARAKDAEKTRALVWHTQGIRANLRKQGLDFFVHADAAWGGYHASLIRDDFDMERPGFQEPPLPVGMNSYAAEQFAALARADSITVDPHKSGYIPYPAGALCYRNSAMRDLVTFAAPVVFHGDAEPTVGIYGIEGSKPGAAAAAVYLSHRVIRPTKSGYGQVIGQAMFTCKMLYFRLLCLDDPRVLVTPVPRLPSERDGGDVAGEIKFIRERFLGKTNDEIRAIPDVHRRLAEFGPDQNILAYAFNFRTPEA